MQKENGESKKHWFRSICQVLCNGISIRNNIGIDGSFFHGKQLHWLELECLKLFAVELVDLEFELSEEIHFLWFRTIEHFDFNQTFWWLKQHEFRTNHLD